MNSTRMVLFELVVALLFAGALFALWADRVGAPYPALLALVGAAIAFVPGVPEVQLDPHLALALFVAPTLLDAAYDASLRDLRKHLSSVFSLAVALVLVTIAAVAWVLRLVMPDVSWAAAIALGAIVAPPDASAATAVLRKVRPPHRLLVILEGESLFNDATALLVYRMAVAVAMTGVFTGWSVVPTLLLTCGGGVVAGYLLAKLQIWATSRLDDIAIHVLLQFLATFAVWMLAERVGLSAIITVVVFAMTEARVLAGRVNARLRIASYVVWEVAVLILNVLAFVLIGLQLRTVVSHIHGEQWSTYALAGVAVCATVIVIRFVWIMLHAAVARRFIRWRTPQRTELPSYGSGLLASWCGMRGIVTLATALALPGGDNAFPHREILVFCAFCVVLTTLVLQGLTLRPLLERLGLQDDGTVEREAGLARAETTRAALHALEQEGTEPAARTLRGEYLARLHAAESPSTTPTAANGHGGVVALQHKAVVAQREALCDLRARNLIGDAAFHVVEQEIDLLELTADARVRPEAERHAT